MANLAFLTRIIQNVKSEADWIADENYQILPNQSVESYVIKQVEVDGTQKNMLFVRSKTNTTTSNKLFKDLPYNDEYLMYMVQDNINTALQSVTDEINTLSGTVSTMSVDVGTLKTDMTNAQGDITTLTNEVDGLSGLSGTVSTLSTDVTTLSGKVDTNTTNISNMQGDLNTAVDEVTSLSGTVSTLNTDMANKMDKSGGTFTGAVQLPAISGTAADTQAITAKYMKDYIDANPAGTQVVLSSTQPQNLPSGSIWLKQV